MTPRARSLLLYGGGIAALCGAGWAAWYLMRSAKASALADQLAPTLPARLARWAGAIAHGAVATVPSDFDGGALGWAQFGAAIMDRETLGGSASSGYRPDGAWDGTGDAGHAHTPWQLDDRYHAAYLARTDRTPERDSEYAMQLLADRWDVSHDLKTTAAAYNSGRSLDVFASGGDPDTTTTGGNYGADVLSRMAAFQGA